MKKNNTFEIKTKKYKVGDIYLNVAEAGQGGPLVFIHGWSNSWIGWTLLANELSPYYKLYMVDLPGFGDSDSLPRYSLEIVNRYLSEFIDKYVPSPRAIIGASAGTFVAVHMVTTNRYNTSLILIGTVLKQRRTALIKEAYSRLLTLSTDSKLAHNAFERVIKNKYSAYFVEKYIDAYRFDKKLIDLYFIPGRKKVNGKSYIQMGVAIMGYVLDEELHNIRNKTLLIFGSADKYVSLKTAESLLKKVKNSNLSLRVIDKSGHSPSYEQPKETARIIREYLDSEVLEG